MCACNIVPTHADDKMLSGEDEEAVVWEDSGKLSGTPVPTGEDWEKKRCELDWQVGDISVICDNGASCNMSYSYTGVINYREAKTFMKTASGTRYPIEGCGDLPQTFCSGREEAPL